MEGSTSPCVTHESAWAYHLAKEGEDDSEGITPIERMIACTSWDLSIGEASVMGPGIDLIAIVILWIITCLYFVNFKAIQAQCMGKNSEAA